MKTLLCAIALALGLAGCSALPDKPVRETLYDFGPGPAVEGGPPSTSTPLVVPDVEVSASLEGSSMFYRLGYADPNQLLPYAYARWSAPPASPGAAPASPSKAATGRARKRPIPPRR